MGEPVRPREPAHQRRGGRAARGAAARDVRRLHARAGTAARGAADGAGAAGPEPLLLRRQRLGRDRGRGEDELPLLAEPRPAAQDALRDPRQQLPRRDARGAGGRQRRALQGDLPAAADGRDHRALPRRLPARVRRVGGGLRAAAVRRARAHPGRGRGRDRGGAGRAAGAVRGQHAHVRPGLPRAAARGLRPPRRAPDRRRDRGGLRAHRHDVRLRAGGDPAGLHVPLEGPHRRLPADVGGADHRRGLRRVLRRIHEAECVPAFAQLQRQPAGLRGGARDAADLRRRRRAGAQPRARRAARRRRRAARRPSARRRGPPARHDPRDRVRARPRDARDLPLARAPPPADPPARARARRAAAAARQRDLLHAALRGDAAGDRADGHGRARRARPRGRAAEHARHPRARAGTARRGAGPGPARAGGGPRGQGAAAAGRRGADGVRRARRRMGRDARAGLGQGRDGAPRRAPCRSSASRRCA